MATDNEDRSFGDRVGDAFSQIGRDIGHATGLNPYSGDALADYNDRTADTRAINAAVASGDTSAFSDRPDMMSRYGREAMMSRIGNEPDNSGIASLSPKEEDMSKIYAENLRRYNEYMEQQKQQPQQPAITPEMRQAALQTFESQRGAGQMPYYMAAAANSQAPDMSPAFQYAAQNYATLGGSQRLAPRPMEMMSVAERRQINDMAQSMADQQAAEEEQRRLAERERYRLKREADMRGDMGGPRFRDIAIGGGMGKGGPRTAPQQGGGFNSMEELMEFQRQNPTMNLMGEYQRLKALEAGSQQAAADEYQAGMDMVLRGGIGKGGPRTAPQVPRPPMPQATSFAPMLMSRFGRFGS